MTSEEMKNKYIVVDGKLYREVPKADLRETLYRLMQDVERWSKKLEQLTEERKMLGELPENEEDNND